MRFPSVDILLARATDVLRRFPWTIGVAVAAAAAGIIGTLDHTDDELWARIALTAALGLPATIAVTLAVARERGREAIAQVVVLALLALFFVYWPGPEEKHHAIRYVQLSAALHLAVAFLPFLGAPDTDGFWQYNRRLFEGFLRAVVFSAVLFVGLVIALGALDKLFGVDVEPESYFRTWLFIAFVVNTWIFLATVPEDIPALSRDREYPKALKVFSQYILTPLVFIYMVILLAYLVKIVAGAEWPSGWIGWLVTSVAVAGLLGFLLVHPLRSDPEEGWIRVYARWLFIGLIPSALMLLTAFWKRILPYGLTELRFLGLLLGLWLLGISILFTVRRTASIRIIPVTLAILLLVTLYGPTSLTSIAVGSQQRRLASLLPTAATDRDDGREASAALRFLMEHDAEGAIATAIGKELPDIDLDSVPNHGDQRDSVATRILALAGVPYVPEYWAIPESNGAFYVNAGPTEAMPVAGFDWVVRVWSSDTTPRMAGADTVRVAFDQDTGIARIQAGRDTLTFNVGALAARIADSLPPDRSFPAGRLRIDAAGPRRAALLIGNLNGERNGERIEIQNWGGSLLLANPDSLPAVPR
ncbi:MAG TPA: DUF4153 domain-containing protein [Gemmatimonadales bacterium]|nr:DUF4153 domain-containing protein [Gemmatimonadales bacterium]